ASMRLQYLSDASPRLIRLFDFTSTEAQQLAMAVADLSAERVSHVAIHELSWVTAVDGCELTLCVRRWDQAVLRTCPTAFECGFTPGTWDNVCMLIEPFVSGSGGFQWLAGVPGGKEIKINVAARASNPAVEETSAAMLVWPGVKGFGGGQRHVSGSTFTQGTRRAQI